MDFLGLLTIWMFTLAGFAAALVSGLSTRRNLRCFSCATGPLALHIVEQVFAYAQNSDICGGADHRRQPLLRTGTQAGSRQLESGALPGPQAISEPWNPASGGNSTGP